MTQTSMEAVRARRQRLVFVVVALVLGLLVALAVVNWWEHAT